MFLYQLREYYVYLTLPAMGFAVLIALAGISLLKGRKNTTNRLFALICFLGALINFDVALVSFLADRDLALILDRLTYLFFVFGIPVYIHFVHSFLGITTRRWLERAAYLFSAVLFPLTQTRYFITGFHEYSFGIIGQAGPAYSVFATAGGCAVLYCIITLYRGMTGTSDNHYRNRIKYVLVGLGLTSFLIMLNFFPVTGFNIYPMGNLSFLPALVLAVGVLKYDLLDMGALLRKGTLYFILTGILTAFYVLVIYLFNVYFMEKTTPHSVALPLALALLIVLFFNPMRERIQMFVERSLFMGTYDYRKTLRNISNRMTTLLRIDEIADYLTTSLDAALNAEKVSFLLCSRERETIGLCAGQGRDASVTTVSRERTSVAPFFERRKEPLIRSSLERLSLRSGERKALSGLLEVTGAELLVPVLYRGVLSGLIALGEKRSGRIYVHEDVELLTTVANQTAIAVENAERYRKIENINLELEEKVARRTAALQEALDEKERTQQQLIRSESLAAIGQLVAGTAHELNNPLASASSLIETSIESAGGWLPPGREADDMIDDLRFSLKELKRAGNIVKSLLYLSRQTSTYVETVDIHHVIGDALRILHNCYKNREIEMILDFAEDLPAVEGNFANLGQVFLNIIRNAVEALPERGGTITLTTRHERETGRISVICGDTGQGIDDDIISEIFNPFFTTKAPGKGTGLGLYISHEIVKRHGGNIHVRNEAGRGAVVTVELPCKRGE